MLRDLVSINIINLWSVWRGWTKLPELQVNAHVHVLHVVLVWYKLRATCAQKRHLFYDIHVCSSFDITNVSMFETNTHKTITRSSCADQMEATLYSTTSQCQWQIIHVH